MKDFTTPPNHIHFLAKKLFGNCGEIMNGSIAYLEPEGGGPVLPHTHEHNHLFIVIQGRVRIKLDGKDTLVNANESFLVHGEVPHSIWNDTNETTIMVGISIRKSSGEK